jgi:DMATS type aromatic prenyltransferase
MSSLSLKLSTRGTFLDAATNRLHALWGALYRKPCPADVLSLLSAMFSPWGSSPIPREPSWPSDIGNDHSPFEFSVALTPISPEIRLVVEAQGVSPGFTATREACLRLNKLLEERGADLRRFEQVRDLFVPEKTHARFALWHAVALTPGPLRAKAYLNPQIHGVNMTCHVVRSAFERLGLARAWPTLASARSNGPLRDEDIRYFALDLERSRNARVKVYLYLPDATADDLERLAGFRPGYVAGEVSEFCRELTGSTGPYAFRPPCVYLAFTENNPTPSDVTVQIPIAYHAPDDRIARNRVLAYLRMRGLDTTTYERALAAAAQRPFHTGSGLHTYVSLRTGMSPPRVTTYFGAELYGVQPPLARSSRTIRRAR